MGSSTVTTPLAASYARLGAVPGDMDVRVAEPAGDERSRGYGWVTGEQLSRDGGRRAALIDAEGEHARSQLGLDPRRDVAATWVFQHYLWAVGALLCWPMLLDRRVPRVSPADVALHMPFDGRISVVVAPTAFDCLPDDPDADDPGARVAATRDALYAAARESARAHMAPLTEAFGAELRRGSWALWGTVTDQLVGGLWYLGTLLGDEERGVAEAQALLPGGTPPFAGSADFGRLELPGGSVPTRRRLSCCLLYTVAPDAVCATCPRLRDAERATRLAGNRNGSGAGA